MRYRRKIVITALALLVGACTEPSGVTLQWMPPSQYDDGGTLPEGAVTESLVYVDQEMVQRLEPHLTEYFLELPSGEWEVTISAVAGNVESRLSEPLSVVID